MEINFRGRKKKRNAYKKRMGRGEEGRVRERERWNKQCGGKIHTIIKMERISFLQTPFVPPQKDTPIF
jgi:hypothetical protein